MSASDFLRRLEERVRRFIEVPLEGDAPPLVLRDRILEAVEDRVVPALASGEPVAGRLTVRLHAPDAERRALLDEVLVAHDTLADSVRRRLSRVGAPPAASLALVVTLDEAEGPPFEVAWEPPSGRAAVGTRYRLTVLEGTADEDVYTFDADAPVFVGRLREVHDAAGRLVRRNDVAFEDAEGPNETVSRAHAVLRRPSPADDLRVYDESTRGTAVFRDASAGLITVRRRGLPVRHGDLIYFGDARVRFEWIRDEESAGGAA